MVSAPVSSGRSRARAGWLARARRLLEILFATSPYKEHRKDFNVWALTVPVPVSGVSRPSTGIHRASATGLRTCCATEGSPT